MENVSPQEPARIVLPSELNAEGSESSMNQVLSDETLRFIDLWFDDGSWALEELGGHENTIITEILKAADITKGNGASRWRDGDDSEALTYNCHCGHRRR